MILSLADMTNVMENKKVYQKQHQTEYRLHDTTIQELLPDPATVVS